jgi:hypothetical protein
VILHLKVFKSLPGGLHHLGARCRLRRLELPDPLLQLPLLLLCLELMLGQQHAPPFEHFLLEGEVYLSPGDIRRLPVQGHILLLEVLLGEGNVAGLVLQLPLPFFDLLYGLHLLDLLGL